MNDRTAIHVTRQARPDPEATLASIETLLAGTKESAITIDRADLEAIATVARNARREAQAVWRCSISDFVGCLDVLRKSWVDSRRKAEREAGARLGAVLDVVYAGRNPAPADHSSAENSGRALIERVRETLESQDGATPKTGTATKETIR